MGKRTLPIAVFDSGVGGLTVLKALQQHLPNESFIYLGDTARLPYGTKSEVTVTKYAQQAAHLLIHQGIKLLVIACNTASTLALPTLIQNFASLPIIGTLEPGAQAVCQRSKTACVAVIATEATISSQGYQQAIWRIRSDMHILAQSCSLFVALAEEGWAENPITEAVSRHYLEPLLFGSSQRPDCLLLGCTHFPILAGAIAKIAGENIAIIDSAHTTAMAVKLLLDHHQLSYPDTTNDNSYTRFLVTDSPKRFAKIAKQFLQVDIHDTQIELVET